MRISDWSSDVCSSDLQCPSILLQVSDFQEHIIVAQVVMQCQPVPDQGGAHSGMQFLLFGTLFPTNAVIFNDDFQAFCGIRSEEHTSELQSLMRISYAVFCLKKKKI